MRVTYDLVVGLHVSAALLSVGAFAASTGYALAGSRVEPHSEAAARFFRSGTPAAARSIDAVPVLGLVLLAMNRHGYGLAQPWLWVSVVAWAVAALIAHAGVWPAEGDAAHLVAARQPGDPLSSEVLRSAYRRVAIPASATTACLFVAIALMVLKPGAPR